jgi:hypothetical protein
MAEPVRIRIASLGWSASWCDTIIRAVQLTPPGRLACIGTRAFCVVGPPEVPVVSAIWCSPTEVG